MGFFFAGGVSKGIPRKNLRVFSGKPLIAHAIDVARASRLVDRVVVSTDDPEIAEEARRFGAEVPFLRPKELAQDDTPEWLAWRHAIGAVRADGGGLDIFLSLPPTSPLRSVEDVDACVSMLLGSDADIVITAMSSDRNPFFNMISLDAAGFAHPVVTPAKPIFRRQDAPIVYDMTTVAYAARPDFILRASGIFEGKVKAVFVPAHRAIDIDSEADFEYAEFLAGRPPAR